MYSVSIDKHPDEDLGLAFEDAVFDGIRPCANRCLFCFIAQQPEGLRESLYVRDDDYRLSFLHGTYITLTNLGPRDYARIQEQGISPLYVSIHTTNPELRAQMLGTPRAAKIHDDLKNLAESARFHAQIVLVPGYNDGAELDRTIRELSEYLPDLLSISIVPVGLTKHRENLSQLTPANKEWAEATIKLVKKHQTRFRREWDDPIVRLADEFYLLAGQDFPGVSHYGDFEQLEDGIGLARLFLHEWKRLSKKLPQKCQHQATLVTGQAAHSILAVAMERLAEVEGLNLTLKPLVSRFWGDRITVTGLLTGQDIINGLTAPQGEVWVPSVMIRKGTDCFLDGVTLTELSEKLGCPVRVIPASAEGLAGTIIQIAETLPQ